MSVYKGKFKFYVEDRQTRILKLLNFLRYANWVSLSNYLFMFRQPNCVKFQINQCEISGIELH